MRGRAPHTSAWLMLRRNLLYTAVTRAKRIVVVVGSKRAIARAVRTEGGGAAVRRPGRTPPSWCGHRGTIGHSGNQGDHRLIMPMWRG